MEETTSQFRELRTDGSNVSDLEVDLSTEGRVLVLYTGGTIGMKVNERGVYVPEPNYLAQELRKLPMFHDAKYNLSKSIEKLPFSGESARVASRKRHESSSMASPLVMPCSKGEKYVIYSVYEYYPLLDSCNITVDDWARIALDIHQFYKTYDGFVILHGTDTMAYTASALSFMLENLGKPVIVTGSQVPIFETLSDGRDNLLGALHIAGHYCIPEVTVYFDNKLFRGNRVTKVDATQFDAFNSPNLPPLVTVGVNVCVDWPAIVPGSSLSSFTVHSQLHEHVGLLRLFPSVAVQTIRSFLQPPMAGVVLQTYGAGNCPSNRPDLLQAFKEASNQGVLILNITQCQKGHVSVLYETGKALSDVGVVPGSDMTPEAALSKLAYVLSKKEWSLKQKREMLLTNLRGEMTTIQKEDPAHKDDNMHIKIVNCLSKAMSLSSSQEIQMLKDAIFPSLICYATVKGDLKALEAILKQGGSLNVPDHDQRSALHIACAEGRLDIVQFLLNAGAIIHMKDRFGQTALADAVASRNFEVIKLLVQGGAHLAISKTRIAFELCQLSALNDVDGLESWRLAGADLNLRDYDNRSPLHVAVCKRSIDAVRYLMEHGADPDAEDIFGTSPLQYAYLRKMPEIEQLITDMTKQKRTPWQANVE